MKSIREIYKIGKGPSSSHTMGPERAGKLFKSTYPQADAFTVILYGSLSKTGVGHGTDRVLMEVLSPIPTEIQFSKEELTGSHPNTMDFFAMKDGVQIGSLRVESIGGGDIRFPGQSHLDSPEIYLEHSFAEIADFCKWRYIDKLSDYVELKADPDAEYDEEITVDLSSLVPMVALPHSPDNVKTVEEAAGIKVDQVAIGSCTNSS